MIDDARRQNCLSVLRTDIAKALSYEGMKWKCTLKNVGKTFQEYAGQLIKIIFFLFFKNVCTFVAF